MSTDRNEGVTGCEERRSLVEAALGLVEAVAGERLDRVGCERQLEMATRRLRPFAPQHRGLDLEAVLSQVDAAAARVASGSLDLPPVRL